MKKQIVFVVKLIVFTIGLILLFNRLTAIFTLKEYLVGPNVNVLISPYVLCEKQDGFYCLEDNTLDVVFLGSSNVHCNVNPNVIWNEYGITSYDYSADQQDLGTSYYYLKQVFESQSPSVVVVDVMGSGDTDDIGVQSAHFSFDHMKNDKYKFEAIWNRTTSRWEMVFPIIAYHERWKELTCNDYKYRPNEYNCLKGAFIYMLVNKQEMVEIPENIPQSELPNKTVQYIDKIVKLCEENDTHCVFMKTPYAYYDEACFSYFDAIDLYCKKANIPFLYLNKLVEEIGLDYDIDYTDTVHMNWNGQRKLSSYLGKYLLDNYEFEDKRQDTKYQTWTDDYNTMMYYIDNFWTLYEENE